MEDARAGDEGLRWPVLNTANVMFDLSIQAGAGVHSTAQVICSVPSVDQIQNMPRARWLLAATAMVSP